jgi:hypothetical protein
MEDCSKGQKLYYSQYSGLEADLWSLTAYREVKLFKPVERIHLAIKRRRAGRATPESSGRDLERATLLSVHGSANQPISATAFVKHILRRAEKEGDVEYRKVLEIVREEGARGPPRAGGF